MRNFLEIKGKKVLVTGASGFIGSHFCKYLYQSDVEVHGVSRIMQQQNFDYVRWWHGDVSDMLFVQHLLSSIKPDIIFHLAGHVVGSRALTLVMPTFHSNLLSTINLLTVATEIGCERIILIGSLEEPDRSEINPVPSSPYAAAKWAGSAYGRMFHALYQTPVVIARLFMVYGPGQQDITKLIPSVTLSLLRSQSPQLSSGIRQIDWIYVEDVVAGLLSLAKASDIEGHTIDLGSGILTSIRTVVEHIVNLVNPKIAPLFGALQDRPMEQVRVARISETFNKIGWKPSFSLEKGLALTVDWYRNQYIPLKAKVIEQ